MTISSYILQFSHSLNQIKGNRIGRHSFKRIRMSNKVAKRHNKHRLCNTTDVCGKFLVATKKQPIA